MNKANLSHSGFTLIELFKDEKTRGDIPDLDEHGKKIIEEFNN